MRKTTAALTAALALALLAPRALADCGTAAPPNRNCQWTVLRNVSPTDAKSGSFSSLGLTYYFKWSFSHNLTQNSIQAQLTGFTTGTVLNSSDAGSGNATYVVVRTIACDHPLEDIEATAKNEFKATAALDDDNWARAFGSMSIKASKVRSGKTTTQVMHSHAVGGAESTASGHGDDDALTGTLVIRWSAVGIKIPIHWSRGGNISKVFQDTDGGAGGRSPETFTLQTAIETGFSIGSWWDDATAEIIDSKSFLQVWGTCDGDCKVMVLVINESVGY